MKKANESTSEKREFEKTMTTKELAEKVKLTPRSIRYYEEIGILGGISRDPYNRRRYTERDVYFLKLLKRAKNLLGLSLNEISELSSLFQSPDPTEKEVIERSIEMLKEHIKRVSAQEEQLKVSKSILVNESERLQSLLKQRDKRNR